VTIPVNGGDQIYASSFVSGIRTTYFDAEGVLISLTASKVVNEFNKNGYLTAPEGAVAVNIPMPSNSNDWEIYILNRAHCYENGTCAACGDHIGPVIVQQPVSVEAALGESYKVTVKAEGEDLKYQWYLRNAGDDTWYPSAVTTKNYSGTMTNDRAGREVYCVITDAQGKSVTTDTVKLIRGAEKLTIVTQPKDSEVALGETYRISVDVKGDGLKYQWYIRNEGSDKWYPSAVTTKTYSGIMTKARAGRKVYCVITDAQGNSVTTDVAKLIRGAEKLTIVAQPADSHAALGEKCSVSVVAQGEGLRYQWYIRNANSDQWYLSAITARTYTITMTKARANREVCCVITDSHGNQVTTQTATLILDKN